MEVPTGTFNNPYHMCLLRILLDNIDVQQVQVPSSSVSLLPPLSTTAVATHSPHQLTAGRGYHDSAERDHFIEGNVKTEILRTLRVWQLRPPCQCGLYNLSLKCHLVAASVFYSV